MEDLKDLLFTLYSNCKTNEECINIQIKINKLVLECKTKRFKELKRGKENGF